MNRRIKYKGKRIDNGEWVYGYFIKLPQPLTAFLKDYIVESGYQDFILVEPETVCQFTGVYDKDGEEIYEGDELSIIDETRKKGVVTVGFEEGGFIVFKGLAWRNIGHFDVEKNEFKVIGNIHDKEI